MVPNNANATFYQCADIAISHMINDDVVVSRRVAKKSNSFLAVVAPALDASMRALTSRDDWRMLDAFGGAITGCCVPRLFAKLLL